MRKFVFIGGLLAACLLVARQSSAAVVEFKPQNARFVSPKVKAAPVQKFTAPSGQFSRAVSGSGLSDEYVRSLVVQTVSDLAARGVIKNNGNEGQGGSVAGATTESSVDPDAVGLQPTIIRAAIVGPDVGTIFGASVMSAASLSASSASLGDTELNGNLTVTGNADLQGEITLATTTVADLHIANSLTSDSGAFLSPGGTWTNASSRTLKENFATVTPVTVLDNIDKLQIYTWNYKKENSSVTHMGLISEDFYDIFKLGNSNGSISTIDPSGVALAGIQALNAKVKAMMDFSWVADYLKKMGAEVSEGLVKVKSFIADAVATKTLEVGSSDQPTGITLYDRATGQPSCVYMEHGVLTSEAGKCGVQNDVSPSPAPAAPVPAASPDEAQEPVVPVEVDPEPVSEPNEDSQADAVIGEQQPVAESIEQAPAENSELLPVEATEN